MFRKLFIALSKLKWAQRLISKLGFARRASRRFIAGETVSDAVSAIRQLNAAGIQASIDYLGENAQNADDAAAAAGQLIQCLESIRENQLRANLSIKLSQVGLALDVEICRENLSKILAKAAELNLFVRIDMEDSSMTEKTLLMLEWALSSGFDKTGIVIQAYLYRSEEDIQRLALLHARVRLCKGAYSEPPAVAFAAKADVDENYDRLAGDLLEIARDSGYPEATQDGVVPPIPAIATHDPARIEAVIQLMRLMQIPAQAVEFQMLYGIRRDLQQSLSNEGYPVRVYVPFGSQWWPYYMRRLAERPANAWFFISSLFKR